MTGFLGRYWNELWTLTVEMAPYLLLGFLFAGILYAWFPPALMTRFMGKRNFSSVLNASLLGIPLPLCSCGVIPTGISFRKSGASNGATVSFLISTPQTGIDSILVTWSLLGIPMAIIRPIIALFTGVFGGLLTNYLEKNQEPAPAHSSKHEPETTKRVGIIGMLRYAFVDFLSDIVKWLVIGLLLAALLAVIIPDDFFLKYLSNDYLSMGLVLLASIPLYMCATGSVPIAAVLMMKGLSPGAAIVFLMAGPATNAATISVIGNALGKKTLLTYLSAIVSGALFFGILVNEFLPREWFTYSIHAIHQGGHSHEILPHWLQISSAIILSSLIVYGLFIKYTPLLSALNIKNTTPISNINMATQFKEFKVEGMSCNHCKTTVENNLLKVSGIKSAKADIQTGKVIVEGLGIDSDTIKKTITSLGYRYLG